MEFDDGTALFVGYFEADALSDDGVAEDEVFWFSDNIFLHFRDTLLAALVGVVDEDVRHEMDASDVFGILQDFLEHLQAVDFRPRRGARRQDVVAEEQGLTVEGRVETADVDDEVRFRVAFEKAEEFVELIFRYGPLTVETALAFSDAVAVDRRKAGVLPLVIEDDGTVLFIEIQKARPEFDGQVRGNRALARAALLMRYGDDHRSFLLVRIIHMTVLVIFEIKVQGHPFPDEMHFPVVHFICRFRDELDVPTPLGPR